MDLNQQFTTGMLSFTDQPDFDYAAFLQADDITFGEGAQTQQQVPSDSSDKATPPSTTSGSSSELIARPSAQKQRLERRGHTKSRRGCYNCKRRRIKCQETRPACGHCTKTGLKCEYPSMPQITHQPHHQIPLFSLQDMRFFQHFLTQCYPHHPLKQEDIWTHEIPCIAHNHEYLMHAILGFSASELMRNDASIVSSAMNHRIKAIRAIKKRLAETARSSMDYEEANAMVATCYALTFQSDALLEPLMQGLPLIPRGYTDSAMAALTNLRPLCERPVEVEYHQHLVKMAEKLYVNSWDAYKAYTAQYGWWMLLPHDTFQALIDPDNQVMMLLHSHWVAINEIMSPISGQERNVSENYPPQRDDQPQLDPGFARWLKHINANIDLEHQIYNQWPMWVEEQLDNDITFFGRI
ncbi:UPC2-like regulatory protein [Fusarium tjaetaba]|uniref:UPC2-like regulatory protein n=1 Tax=Fusarium tjaetaba TaxID=1567544 RepID=A0A8H5QKB3_9HYPO|nr:UPC2-like regulatory protein [Fusarium tjaetaba]KAF5616815.1 UPC2-like regulatory protein [Fusarium tjaetaba]